LDENNLMANFIYQPRKQSTPAERIKTIEDVKRVYGKKKKKRDM